MIRDMSKFPPHSHETVPYDHQLREFEKSKNREYYALWWEMGTGKSKPIIDTAAHLFLTKEIDGLVIVSDKGAYLNWEINEIPLHMPKHVPYRVAHWSSSASAQELRDLNKILQAQDDLLDILCVNVESLSSGRAVDFVNRFIGNHYVLMAVDEATSIKGYKSARSKNCRALGMRCDYRRVLTGTPVTQSPMDLFSICEFLKPNCLHFPTLTAFRSFYCELQLVKLPNNRFPFAQILGYKNLDHLSRQLEGFSSRILKSECLDLPPKIYEVEYVEMTPEQTDAYHTLRRTAVWEVEQGLLTSVSALTTINKLQQIVCGHVKLDSGVTVDLPNNRIPILINKLQNIDGKVIIWCAYQRDVELIYAAIAKAKIDKELDGYCVHYYGKTLEKDRPYNLELFKKDPRCRWLVGTAATGGKGLTLTEASTTIYYSNSYSLEDRLQSEDRNHRIGQTSKVLYIDLISRKTVDEKIVLSLKKKEDLAHQVLDHFRELLTP